MADSPLYDAHGRDVTALLGTATGFDLFTDFNPTTGLGTVKMRVPGSDAIYELQPQDARNLGLKLIANAEAAVYTAIGLKLLIGPFEVNPSDAMAAFVGMMKTTRAAHALAFAELKRQEAAARGFEEEQGNGPRKPS